MIQGITFGTPLSYKLLQYVGLVANAYYLVHMVLLNVQFGEGITPYRIWKQMCFLTNINHVLIFIYHLWSVLSIFRGAQRSSSLRKYYQFVFNLSFFATISYWSLRLVDQRLIHGRHTSAELGELYQIFIHGFNHFLLILEVFIEDKENQWGSSFIQFTPFFILYTIQLAVQQFYFGRNVYGFQKQIAPYGFLVSLAAIPILVIIDKVYTHTVFNYFKCQVIEDRAVKKNKKID